MRTKFCIYCGLPFQSFITPAFNKNCPECAVKYGLFDFVTQPGMCSKCWRERNSKSIQPAESAAVVDNRSGSVHEGCWAAFNSATSDDRNARRARVLERGEDVFIIAEANDSHEQIEKTSDEAEAASNLLDEINNVAASGGVKETHIDAPRLTLHVVKLLPFVIGAGISIPILLLVFGPLALIYILPAAGLFVLFSIFVLWPWSKRPKRKAGATEVAISAVIFIILIVLRLSDLS